MIKAIFYSQKAWPRIVGRHTHVLPETVQQKNTTMISVTSFTFAGLSLEIT